MRSGQQFYLLTAGAFQLQSNYHIGLKVASNGFGALSIRNSRIDMKPKKIPFTQDEMKAMFRYEPETGKLFRRVRRKGHTIGEEAGTLTPEK